MIFLKNGTNSYKDDLCHPQKNIKRVSIQPPSTRTGIKAPQCRVIMSLLLFTKQANIRIEAYQNAKTFPTELPLELLEMIVGHLPKEDVFKARSVSKEFLTVIDGTGPFNRQVFRHPQFNLDAPKAIKNVPGSQLRGKMTVHLRGTALVIYLHWTQRAYLTNLPSPKGDTPDIYKKMFLTQPPIKSILFNFYPYVGPGSRPGYGARVTCETGITVGIMIEAFEAAEAYHLRHGYYAYTVPHYFMPARFRASVEGANICDPQVADARVAAPVLVWTDERL